MQIDFTLPTDKPYAEAIEAVKEAAAAHSFRVSFVHDIAETLSERGFTREPLSIVEMCNAKFASEVLDEDVDVQRLRGSARGVASQPEQVLNRRLQPVHRGQ